MKLIFLENIFRNVKQLICLKAIWSFGKLILLLLFSKTNWTIKCEVEKWSVFYCRKEKQILCSSVWNLVIFFLNYSECYLHVLADGSSKDKKQQSGSFWQKNLHPEGYWDLLCVPSNYWVCQPVLWITNHKTVKHGEKGFYLRSLIS